MRSCAEANVKYTYESHNNIMHQGSTLLSNYWAKTLIKETRKRRFCKLIAISDNLKNYWISQGVQESKIIALHDGFSDTMFRPEIMQIDARKFLGLPLNKKIVVYSGSIFADREVDNIVMLAQKIPSAYFVVVGGPQKNVKYFQYIVSSKRLQNISFVGRKPHYLIPHYLFASDVLLGLWSRKVPTINYCSPLKIFEYMASGRVIVAHAFPTIREVLTDKNAYLADPDDFEHLLVQVKRALLLSYPNEIAENARHDAMLTYTWNKRAKLIMENVF